MKHFQPSAILRLIVLIFLTAGVFYGCAAKSPTAGKEPGALVPINKIEPRETEGKTEIVVEGAGPLQQYTSFQLTEPLRLVVDISDADIRKFPNKIPVGKGAILDIVPSQMDNIARLEIGLSQEVDTKLNPENGKLVIEIAKSAEQAKPAPEEAVKSAVTPTAQPPAEETEQAKAEKPAKGTATVVTGVRATAGKEGGKVVIVANGTMVPNTFMIEGKRLVVDIPGTRSKVRPKVIPVRKGGLDKVRVGQYTAQTVRVVLDLTGPMAYTATAEGNKIIIALSAATPAKPEEQVSQEKAAPREKATAQETETTQAGEREKSAAAAAPEVAAVPPAPAAPAPAKTESAGAAAKQTLGSLDTASLIGGGKYSGRRISLDLQDADLINVLRLFADVANLNIIIAPEVRGRVTVRMVNIPWDQAMDIILKMNGLGFALEDNILRVASVAALTKEAEEESKSKEAKKKAEDLVTRMVSINYATASVINGTLKKSLSSRGETVVDERTNTIIITDIPKNVNDVLTLIRVLDKAIPQVMIEARIVEATTSFAKDLGVQWGGTYHADAAHGNPTGFNFPNTITATGGPTQVATQFGAGNYLVNLPAAVGAGSGGSIGFNFGSLSKALNLDLALSAMESTGEGKVISTPRVSALDNKEAKIEQGQSIPYTTTSASGTQVQFIDAKLALTVTPHVTPDNKIFMKITATKNAPDQSLTGAGGQPSIRKNEATTEILLSDGETAVIGGILIIDRGYTIQKVPFFGDLPFIGWLFREKSQKDNKTELLIFITPRVVRQEAI
ncbi:MAG TPA: type IV pilus secretin PilQ [Nitrospirota bacterium]|nr:type IV pilus secretin PilQ [Nitrospirota bacterium]